MYSIPEVPTIFINGGIAYPGADGPPSRLLAFEAGILRTQLAFEDAACAYAREVIAESGRNVLVLFDRAALDIRAYLAESVWQATLQAVGVDESSLVARYDMCLHLTTAADGAPAGL